jgi:hypothetical protein
MESEDHVGDQILDRLYRLSGNESRAAAPGDRQFVIEALRHSRADVRERAIFIGGLRWMDAEILDTLRHELQAGSEPSDENRRLMVECLVSAALERAIAPEATKQLLDNVLQSADPKTYEAKAAYIGIARLEGRISKQQFAVIDYDKVNVRA